MIYFCPFRWCNIVVVLISTFEKDMSKANGDACKSLVTTSSTTSADQSPKMVSSCKINGCSTGKFLSKRIHYFQEHTLLQFVQVFLTQTLFLLSTLLLFNPLLSIFFSDNDQLLTNGNAAKDASSKLSKIGRRIRDSCRQHLRGKHLSGGASSAPEDYGSLPAPNVSIHCKWSQVIYRVPVGFPCYIYGKGQKKSQRNLILLKGKDCVCYGETL